MDKKLLLEDIKRMHKIIGIAPTILIESEITEGPVSKEGASLLVKFFTNLERAVVAGGKSYTKPEVKLIIRKIGNAELSNEEKLVISTLTKDAIALDKTLLKRLSNEIYGEIQKLSNRRLKSLYYTKVKRGLKEVLPKEEFTDLIAKVDNKIGVKPKPTPPNPTPAPNPSPNPSPVPNPPFVDITDEEFIRIIKQEFADLNIPLKISKRQEQFFISEVKPKINKLYSEIEPVLATKYKELHLRYNQIEPSIRREAIINAQQALIDAGIGLNIPKKYLHNIGKYLEASFKENATNGYKKLKINLGLNLYSLAIDMMAGHVKTGEWTTDQLFGMSLTQNALFKSILAFVGIFTKGLPSQFLAFGTALVSSVKDLPVIFGTDKGKLLGLSPLSIDDAKTYVESNENPLQLQFENGDKVTKYEPLDVDMKVMEGDKGAFIKIYVNDDTEPYTTLKKDPITKTIKKIDEK